MTDSEAAFVKNLLEMEMDGLPIEKKTKVRMAFHKNKITFEVNYAEKCHALSEKLFSPNTTVNQIVSALEI